ncbi:MAG TPA: ABC transporter substrate-binding protein, partial [Aggregatilineales bacterium]|nr:ABC transporter substrate-binding protein [Aggregatilineales bacterium]
PTSGHDLVRLRADREPGSDPNVQRAFKLATDRTAIFERIQFGFGAQGKDSPIGPVFGQYFAADLEPAPRDPEAAKTLLAEAGYPDGLDLKLYVPDTGNRPDFAITLKDQWEEAGIRVEIELQDEATYYADDGWLEVDLGITGWGARPIPQLFLEFYVKSDAPWNEAHWQDAEIDALVALAGSSLDEAERTLAYHRIQQVMLERGPVIIAYFFAQFMVSAANVDGIVLHPFAGRTNFHTASIS